MAKKSHTVEEKQYLSDVASLGCVCCRNLGYGPTPAQVHHPRKGRGMGQRAAHTDGIPLCPRHHLATYPTGFHANARQWQLEHGTEDELLEQTRKDLAAMRATVIGGVA
jgi:Protein of unknown function (DUF968).